jgi:NAD(P)H-hydrate repair Nnr-like enzyme with NAD(P)H-hydrate epimerase domain
VGAGSEGVVDEAASVYYELASSGIEVVSVVDASGVEPRTGVAPRIGYP